MGGVPIGYVRGGGRFALLSDLAEPALHHSMVIPEAVGIFDLRRLLGLGALLGCLVTTILVFIPISCCVVRGSFAEGTVSVVGGLGCDIGGGNSRRSLLQS
jgi:hypothetical protein